MSIATARKVLVAVLVSGAAAAAPSVAAADGGPFINRFNTITPGVSTVPQTGPEAGDLNPYGVAVVPRTVGGLVKGDVLVSNFNNSANQQGTGSTIVEISPSGQQKVFATVAQPPGSPAVGLTTALVALRNGDVIVGNLPAPGGDPEQASAGALTILDSHGNVVTTVRSKDINGPWDMTAVDGGSLVTLFVTNVLNGTVAASPDINHPNVVNDGTVIRIVLAFGPDNHAFVLSNQVIASGFPERLDAAALVIGPTGVGLGAGDVLYVADSLGNRVAAVPDALFRQSALGHAGDTVFSGAPLNDPLGLTIAPNGDILTVNGNDGNIVETTPAGHLAATKTLIENGGGDLFGLAVAPNGQGVYFVNDGANSLQLLH